MVAVPLAALFWVDTAIDASGVVGIVDFGSTAVGMEQRPVDGRRLTSSSKTALVYGTALGHTHVFLILMGNIVGLVLGCSFFCICISEC